MTLNFLSAKSWDQELSADVSFVSVLAMVLSEYWKRLEKIFWSKIISAISQNDGNYKNSKFHQISKSPEEITRTLHSFEFQIFFSITRTIFSHSFGNKIPILYGTVLYLLEWKFLPFRPSTPTSSDSIFKIEDF